MMPSESTTKPSQHSTARRLQHRKIKQIPDVTMLPSMERLPSLKTTTPHGKLPSVDFASLLKRLPAISSTSCFTAPTQDQRLTFTSEDLADPPTALTTGGSYVSDSQVDISCSRMHCCRPSCHPNGPNHHNKIGSVSGWSTSTATRQKPLTSLRTSRWRHWSMRFMAKSNNIFSSASDHLIPGGKFETS